MHKPVCLKLAWQTLIRNSKITLPYLFGSTIITALIYSITALSHNPGLSSIYGATSITSILEVGRWLVCLFACIFFFYLNSVLIKNRKNEMGLFTVLGMEKKHLIRIIIYQLLILFAANLLIGIPAGILTDKGMMMFCAMILQSDVPIGFNISTDGILWTLSILGVIYLLLFAYSAFLTLKTNPLDLLKGQEHGELEPKNRWIIGIAGLIFLGIGYGIALKVDDPISALLWFFVAVAFVMVGTYLTFIYGSIMILKFLQSNRHYYYKPRHFISVSNMKYRMKQNAASLASIAILSTSVLVGVSVTTMMLVTATRTVEIQYPDSREIKMTAVMVNPEKSQAVENGLKQAIDPDNEGLNAEGYTYFTSVGRFEGADYAAGSRAGSYNSIVFFVPIEDFNRIMNTDIVLKGNELYGYFPETTDQGTIRLNGTEFPVQKANQPIERFYDLDRMQNPYGVQIQVIAANDLQQVMDGLGAEHNTTVMVSGNLSESNRAELDQIMKESSYDLSPAAEKIYKVLPEAMAENGVGEDDYNTTLLSFYQGDRAEALNMFGGLFFIGIYLSLMFLFAVILIMYYKQVSEGTADKKRFRILQNAGLENSEVKKIINDQVLIIFFMPLLMAGLHMAFAYPMLTKMLSTAGSLDSTLFLILIVGLFVLYALIYVVIYRLSAKTYYSIVQDRR